MFSQALIRVCWCFLLSVSARGAVIVSEDFDDRTVGSSNFPPFFSIGSGGQMFVRADDFAGNDYEAICSIVPGENLVSSVSSSILTPALSYASVGGAPGAGFRIVTKFTIDAFSVTAPSQVLDFGLAAFGSSPDLLSAPYQLRFYISGNGIPGKLGLFKTVGFPGTQVTSANALTVFPGLSGIMELGGSYNATGTQLTLTGKVTSGGTTLTVQMVDTSPLPNPWFGYRTLANGLSNGPASVDIDYDDFLIETVPEPTSALMVACGVGGLLVRRRKRSS